MSTRCFQSIVLGLIVIMVVFSLTSLSSAGRIGTWYNYGASPYPRVDDDFVDSTGINSFGIMLSWGIMEAYLESDTCDGSWDCLADSIQVLFPTDRNVERIFRLDFWHPTKMVEVSDSLTYMVHPDSLQDFKDMCAFMGGKLSDRGIHTFVIHNEPNLQWYEGGGPPPFEGGPNWMSGIPAYAEQCSTCIAELIDANEKARYPPTSSSDRLPEMTEWEWTLPE